MKILILNGPNLNLLGRRKVNIYGKLTLDEIINNIKREGQKLGCRIIAHQSNSEGTLVTYVQKAVKGGYAGMIINPGGYTHTSVALRDAVEYAKEWNVPTIEVHLSNIKKREKFRRFSFLSARKSVVIGQIKGQGPDGYITALRKLVSHIESKRPSGKI